MNERGNKIIAELQKEAAGKPAERSIARNNENAENRRAARERTFQKLKTVVDAGVDVVRGVNPLPGALRITANLIHRSALGLHGVRMGARKVDQFIGGAVDKGLRILEARGKEATSADLKYLMEQTAEQYQSVLDALQAEFGIVQDEETDELVIPEDATDTEELQKIKEISQKQLQEIKDTFDRLGEQADKLDALSADLRGQSADYLKDAQDLSLARKTFARLFGLRKGSRGYSKGRIRRQRIWEKITGASSESENLLPLDSQEGTEAEQPQTEQERKAQSLKDVPAQVMILNGIKPLIQTGISFYARGEVRGLSAAALKLAGLGEFAAPAAGAAIGTAIDAARVVKGGRAALYDSAAQSLEGLRTGWFGDRGRTGSESEAEYQKNLNKGRYLRGASGVPLFLLRKVGIGFNALRNAGVQVALRVTKDRSQISQNMDEISQDLEQDTVEAQVVQEKVQQWLERDDVSWNMVKNLGLALARLRAFGGDLYGDRDVYGEEGSGMHPVNPNHDAEKFKKLHEALNEAMQNTSKFTDEQKQQWNEWYDESSSKGKGRERVALALAGSALGTFATLGVAAAAGRLLGERQTTQEIRGEKPEFSSEGDDLQEGQAGIETDSAQSPETGSDTTVPETVQPEIRQIVEEGETLKEELLPEDIADATKAGEAETVPVFITKLKSFVKDLFERPEIGPIGEDQIPWNAIYAEVTENPGIQTNDPEGVTDVIKDIYKAVNTDLITEAIQPDSGFAILRGAEIPTSLPEGAVAYFFSDRAIANLAEATDQAFQAADAGDKLTVVQQAMVDLRNGVLDYQDLQANQKLLRALLQISNE